MVDIYLFSISILGRNELNVKAFVGTFNQEKALVGAFSVIVKLQTSRRFVTSSGPQSQCPQLGKLSNKSRHVCCLSCLGLATLSHWTQLQPHKHRGWFLYLAQGSLSH